MTRRELFQKTPQELHFYLRGFLAANCDIATNAARQAILKELPRYRGISERDAERLYNKAIGV